MSYQTEKSFDDDDDDDDDDEDDHMKEMRLLRLCTPWISTPLTPPKKKQIDL